MTDHEREECGILIYEDGAREDKPPLGRRFSLSDFGGTVPAIGESIIDPFAPGNADRHDPRNRKIWQVRNRCFLPKCNPSQPLVALFVTARAPTDWEGRLLGWD